MQTIKVLQTNSRNRDEGKNKRKNVKTNISLISQYNNNPKTPTNPPTTRTLSPLTNTLSAPAVTYGPSLVPFPDGQVFSPQPAAGPVGTAAPSAAVLLFPATGQPYPEHCGAIGFPVSTQAAPKQGVAAAVLLLHVPVSLPPGHVTVTGFPPRTSCTHFSVIVKCSGTSVCCGAWHFSSVHVRVSV